MSRLLVAVFPSESAADEGLRALRRLHDVGDITLYATGVMTRDPSGHVSVRQGADPGRVGAPTGLAVGSLIGLLGRPAAVLAGAVTGPVVGTLRDFWMAGVGLDFVEEAARQLQPGKVALVAEVEEEWFIPVDAALEAFGGHVLRRTRSEVAESHFDQDIAALKAEIKELDAELSKATGTAKAKLDAKLSVSKRNLIAALQRAEQHVDALGKEVDNKAALLKAQMAQAGEQAKSRLEDRAMRVKSTHHARGAKLSRAWGLAKEALVP